MNPFIAITSFFILIHNIKSIILALLVAMLSFNGYAQTKTGTDQIPGMIPVKDTADQIKI